MKIFGQTINVWISLFVLLSISFAFRFPEIRAYVPFNYDESDYARAVGQGFWTNYLDLNSTPIKDFLKKGIQSAITGTHRTFSEEIRASGDVGFYRHFHPPLAFYPSALLKDYISNPHYVLRLPAWIISVLFPLILFFLYRFIFDDDRLLPSLLCGFLAAIDPLLIEGASRFSTHLFFAVAAAFVLATVTKYFKGYEARDVYIIGMLLVPTILLNSFAIPLTLVCGGSILSRPNPLVTIKKTNVIISYHVIGLIAVMCFAMLIIWPAGILKLSLVKAYLFQTYIIYFKNLDVGTVANSAALFMGKNPPLVCLYATGLIYMAFCAIRRNEEAALLPLFLYIVLVLFLFASNPVARPDYLASILGPMVILAARAMNPLTTFGFRYSKVILSAVSAVLLGCTIAFGAFDNTGAKTMSALIRFMNSQSSTKSTIITSNILFPVIDYYCGESDVKRIYSQGELPESIESVSEGEDVYFVRCGMEAAERNSDEEMYLAEHFNLIQQWKYSENSAAQYIDVFKLRNGM